MLPTTPASLLLAFAAVANAATQVNYTQIPIPDTVVLYHTPGSVKQYGWVEMAIGYPNTTGKMFGVIQYVEMTVTLPNGTDSATNFTWGNPPWSGVQEAIVDICQAIPGDGSGQGRTFGPFNDTGLHTMRWKTTWAWPSYVDPTDPKKCNGTILSQQITEETKTFQVEAADPPPDVPPNANITLDITPIISTLITQSQEATGSALQATTLAAQSQTPSRASVSSTPSSVPNSGESLMKIELFGFMAMAAVILGGGLSLL